jgi:hypothetical protein
LEDLQSITSSSGHPSDHHGVNLQAFEGRVLGSSGKTVEWRDTPISKFARLQLENQPEVFFMLAGCISQLVITNHGQSWLLAQLQIE